MNMFILDENIKQNVIYHVDKHVSKITLEVAQMLCTAHHMNGLNAPYKLAYKNHPVCIWVRENMGNYIWTCLYGYSLAKEYTYRYEKRHKSQDVIEWCMLNSPKLPNKPRTPFAQAMPNDVKDPSAVKAYREYYKKYKSHLFSWKKRGIPYWIEEHAIGRSND